MKIAVTGASGLVGKQLVSTLQTNGHAVSRLVRRPVRSDEEITWDPEIGSIDAEAMEDFDAVVHLAGENIAEGRWDDAKKRRIMDSRVRSTRLLSQTLAKLSSPPTVLLSASATGFYGDRGDEAVDESAPAGEGFLSDVCQQWEQCTRTASEAGIRVVHVRTGIVLSAQGGALKKMLLPFKLGAGGVVGSGKQFWSWISLDDLVGAIAHCMTTESVQGPVNMVAPNAVTNRDFTKTLGQVLGRPTFMPLPAFMARLVLGEMADALLLTSVLVLPKRLQESGYEFLHPNLEEALRHVLGKSPSTPKAAAG